MPWYPAPVIVRLTGAIDKRWPKRDRKSDGTIGDTHHSTNPDVSQHAPDWKSTPPGVVRAKDIDKDGIHTPTVLASLLLHPSTRYVIADAVIYERSRRFRRRAYTGKNPHREHRHDSIRKGYENDKTRFVFLDYIPDWKAGIRLGAKGGQAWQVQAMLIAHGYTLTLDGDFGEKSDQALKAFQGKRNLKVDGIAGPRTLSKMLGK